MSDYSFPPPLSSSPPPFDSVPPPFDDEDEFCHRETHSPTFDITGLSQKLPPTPKGSPYKVSSSNIVFNQDENLKLQFEENNFPNSILGIIPNVIEKDASCLATTDVIENTSSVGFMLENEDEFDDYLDCSSKELNIHHKESSLAAVTDLPIVTSGRRKSGSRNASPEVITHEEVNGKTQLIIAMHRQIVNDKHYASDAEEELNLKSELIIENNEATFDKDATDNRQIRTCKVNSYTSTNFEVKTPRNDFGHYVDRSSNDASLNEAQIFVDLQSSVKTQACSVQPMHRGGDISTEVNEASCSFPCIPVSSFSVSANENTFPVLFDKVLEENNNRKQDIQFPLNSQQTPLVHDSVKSEDAEYSFTATFDTEFETKSSLFMSADVLSVQDDVVRSCSLPTTGCAADRSPLAVDVSRDGSDDDDDFGYRNIDLHDERFLSKKRHNLESERGAKSLPIIIEATNKLVKVALEVDHDLSPEGKMLDSRAAKPSSDDEFDDFVVSTDGPDINEDFEDFTSAKIDNTFGEFAVGDDGEGIHGDFGDDDFGDFSSTAAAAESTNPLNIDRKYFVSEIAKSMSLEASTSDRDPLLNKLESLVFKWVHINDAQSESLTSGLSSLRDVVSDDAFVWRKLECAEWHTVSWQQSEAHQLMLGTLNVDARNILYNQRWSSSVPLFAQSLTFSPLTPAKMSSVLSSGLGSLNSRKSLSGNVREGKSIHVKDLANKTFVSSSVLESNIYNYKKTLSESVELSNTSSNNTFVSQFDDLDSASGCSEPPTGLPTSLQLDWLAPGATELSSLGKPPSDSAHGSISEPAIPAAVQQLLASSSTTSRMSLGFTPLVQLSEEEQKFAESIPDISFMTAKVLMFPIVVRTDDD